VGVCVGIFLTFLAAMLLAAFSSCAEGQLFALLFLFIFIYFFFFEKRKAEKRKLGKTLWREPRNVKNIHRETPHGVQRLTFWRYTLQNVKF